MTTVTSSAEFQRQTGYLVAQEIHEDDPKLSYPELLTLVEDTLERLGESPPSSAEVDGIIEFCNAVDFYSNLPCTGGLEDAA